MKYLVKFFVITFLIFVCTYSKAENEKIYYIDLTVVLNESKAGAEAQVFLTKTANNNVKKFREIEASLKEKEKDLIAKKNVLSKEDYKKMSDNLRKKVQEYQKNRESFFQKTSKQRLDARAKLVEALKPVLEDYSKEHNVSVIMNSKDILFAKSELNITNEVIDLLNKKLPSLNLK